MNPDFQIDTEQAIQDLLHGPKYPDREFVHSGSTFGEVYSMATWLRGAFAELKYPDGAVCLAAENKAIIAAALLASLAGGPGLLLPYAFSSRTLARMKQTTGFVTAVSDLERDFAAGVQQLCPKSAGSSKIPISFRSSSSSEMLKIFTGGSTGTPQVWTKTAGNLFSESFFLANYFEVTEQDCIMATIPPYHIYGLLFSVLLPLVSGATVVNETPSFPNEIVRVVEERKATILVSVPAHYHVLRDVKRSMSLRLASSSAGMLGEKDNELFCRKNNMGVVEVYGSTETGGIASRNRSSGEEFFSPFPTVDWKVTEGRLGVRSPYISPDLAVDTEGFYIASDWVEAQGAHRFSLKGRTDNVTKVGGKRVDLEEICLLIKNEQGVTDCVVMALPESGGREHQIGALVQGSEVDKDKMRKTLVSSLEPYAMPRRIKAVDRIPVKKNGKYDWVGIVHILTK